jgi:hypothetical protein
MIAQGGIALFLPLIREAFGYRSPKQGLYRQQLF